MVATVYGAESSGSSAADAALQSALNTKADTSALAAVALSGSYNDLLNKPTEYTLPTASPTTLGGVKVDNSTITIDANGVIKSSGGASGTGRTLLTANTTYYVRSDGNDSNNGLTNTSGGAFLTIQHALNVVGMLDLGIYNATIKIGTTGTWTGNLNIMPPVGAGTVILQGYDSNFANTVLTCSTGTLLGMYRAGAFSVQDMTFTGTGTAANCLVANSTGARFYYKNVNFGVGFTSCHVCATNGGMISASGDYTISGGTNWHLFSTWYGTAYVTSRTVTLTGTPNFTGQFVLASRQGGVTCEYTTFSGSATGKTYSVDNLGFLLTTSTTIPGNSAGTTATGGIVSSS